MSKSKPRKRGLPKNHHSRRQAEEPQTASTAAGGTPPGAQNGGADGGLPQYPPVRSAMRFLQSRLEKSQHLIDSGELEKIAKFAKDIRSNTREGVRDRLRAAELEVTLIDKGLETARALDPMEVESGMHTPGVTVTADGKDGEKKDMTFNFRVIIN